MRSISRGKIPDNQVVRTMRKIARASYDKGSGVIVVAAESRDTALARAISLRLVEETGTRFVEVSRAQGTEMRKAMDMRVDSARRQLFSAQEAQRQFIEGNRGTISSFSMANLERTRRSQAVELAEDVYKQAVGDREGAVAKELEATPAVVVVDPIPAVIPPEMRYVAGKSLGAAIMGMVLFGLLLLVRETSIRAVERGDKDAIDLAQSARRTPVIGRLLGWLIPVPKDGFDLTVSRVETSHTPGSKRLTS
ncbi:MAG: hypothetical protein H0W69_08760 [Gemmatimonadaceae bacterium]|nr:hypothetical protein [Gemmatimonadaceae bacterium]